MSLWPTRGRDLKFLLPTILSLGLLTACGGKPGTPSDADILDRFPEPSLLELELVSEIHPRNDWPVDVEMDRLIVLDGESVYVTGFNVSTTWRVDFSGNILGSFGRRGQGPGEFQFALSGQLVGNELWLGSAQVFAVFSLEGNVLRHFQMGQFPTEWDADEKRIVAEVLRFADTGSFVASLETFSKEGVQQSVLISEVATGTAPIKAGKFVSNVDLGHGVLPGLLFTVDAQRHVVYVANSGTYKVTALGLDGSTRWIFQPEIAEEGPPVTTEIAKALVENYVSRVSVAGESNSDFREKIEQLVPDRLCPIHSLSVTPGGLILVARQRGYKDLVYDLIRPDGTLLGTITPPSFLNNTLTVLQMYGDRVAEMVVPENNDAEPFVRIYRVQDPPPGW